MKVAVVILNWNGRDLLETFLPSVVENCNTNVDVYVADNASTDTSISYVQDNFQSVKIIALDKNYGYADGYNRSLNQINADLFVLLNSDVEVTHGWLDGIIKRFEMDDRIAAIQPKILSYNDKSSYEYAGAAGGYIDRWGYTFCRGRIFDHIEKDFRQYDNDSEIFWASGACLFIRSTIYKEVNGLDPDFFAHMEEIDLCWRIKNIGYKIWYEPSSTIYHLGGGTLNQARWQKTFLNFRNNLFLLIKNDFSKWFILKFIFRLFLDGISACKFLFDGYPMHSYAVFKAHVFMYLGLYKMLKKRWLLHKKLNDQNLTGIHKRSIVKAYFYHKKKKYTEI